MVIGEHNKIKVRGTIREKLFFLSCKQTLRIFPSHFPPPPPSKDRGSLPAAGEAALSSRAESVPSGQGTGLAIRSSLALLVTTN